MTREEILEEVKKRLSILESEVDVPSEELLFFRDFVSKCSFNSIEEIIKLETEPVFKAYFLSEVEGLNYKDVSQLISIVTPMLETEATTEELSTVCGELSVVWSNIPINCLEVISKPKSVFSKNFLEINFPAEANELLNGVFQRHPTFQKYQTAAKAYIALIQTLINTVKLDEGRSLSALEEEAKRRSFTMVSSINLVRFIDEVRKQYEAAHKKYKKLIDKEAAGATYDKKRSCFVKRTIVKTLGEKIDWQNINEGFNKMVAHHKSLEKELNKKSRTRTQSAQAYRDFFAYFAGLDQSREITGYRNIVQNIPDEDLKKEILTYIYNRNLEKQESVESDYQALVGPGKTAYYSVLESYSIPRNDETVSRLQSKYTKEQVEASLKQLSSLGINDANLLYQILLVSDEKTIFSLASFFADKEIISKETLQTYPKIFDPNSTCYRNAMQNIDTIIDNGINSKYLYNHSTVLFADPAVVKENISSLQESALLTSISKDSDISFLGNPETKTRLFLATTSENKEALTENISLLNAKTPRWKRVAIMHSLSMPVSKEELPAFLENESFFIPDSKLDDYLFKPLEVEKAIPATKKLSLNNLTSVDTTK